MTTFFKKIRQRLFHENRLGKYLVYAFGEIFLVVIGILIALQINNWNEHRKQENQLDTVLNIVEDNLKSDTAQLKLIIKDYENLDSLISLVLDGKYPQSYFDTINETNFEKCPVCFGLNTVVFDFYPETKGYELLKRMSTYSENIDDDQIQKISTFYIQRVGRIADMRESNFKMITNNLKEREQLDWHSDYCNQKYNKGFITYFSQNQLYKNKLASFKVVAIHNYFVLLKMYQEEAIDLLEELNSNHESS